MTGERAEMEDLFRALYAVIDHVVPPEDIRESRGFLVASEYGLALATIVDACMEDEIQLSDVAISLIERLAASMRMDRSMSIARLRSSSPDK